MQNYKILKLLSCSTVSKFTGTKLAKVNDLSSVRYSMNKNMRFKTSILRSDLCGFCIFVKRTKTVDTDNSAKKEVKN